MIALKHPLPRMRLNSGDPNEAFAMGMFVHECVGEQIKLRD